MLQPLSQKTISKNSHGFHDSAVPLCAVSRLNSTLIVMFISFITFGNSLQGNFVFDDSEAIINNKDVRPDTPLWNLLYNDFWGLPLKHNESHKSYRPLTVLTFRWNYWITGGFHPFSFHLTNVILHGLVSALVIPIVERVLRMTCSCVSLSTALLFTVHPVHTEAVAGIVGRADLLCALFSFLSFLMYAMAASRAIVSVKTVFYLTLSILFCLLALLSKEQGITILGVCCVYDLVILHRIDPVSFLSSPISFCIEKFSNHWKPTVCICSDSASNLCSHHFFGKKQVNEMSMKGLLFRQGVLILSVSLMLFLRWCIMDFKTPVFHSVDNPASFAESFWTRVWNYNYIYTMNAWLLICPEWLCFDWSMGCVPLISTVTDIRLLSVATFYFILLSLVLQGLTSLHTNFGRSVILSLVIIVVPFLPASNLFFRVGFVLAERVLYVPTLGMCILVVLGMQIIVRNKPSFKVAIVFLYCGLLLVFCAKCIHRNRQWHNESILFRSGLSICPHNAKVHYNVAKNAGDMGNHKLAVLEYRIAIKLYPKYAQAMNNLANILREEGNLTEADALLREAVRIKPDFPAAWMNLGIVMTGMKHYQQAEQCYRTALFHRPFYPDCFYNLGNLYLDQKMYNLAYEAWHNATIQRPSFSLAWNNMVIMLENLGSVEKARSVAMKGLSIIPSDPGLHFNLGNLFGKSSQFEEAETHFKKAIELNPLNAVYHSNMGVLYHRWKKYSLAKEKYEMAIQIDPQLKSAITNLNMLKRTSET